MWYIPLHGVYHPKKPDKLRVVYAVRSFTVRQGYGQCSYIRLVNDHGAVHCALLMGKAMVVPLQPVTIPRLELTAALVAVKVSSVLESELNFSSVTHCFWTDSKVVLGYIANETKRFHVFVANRVQQIRDKTEPSQWRYVESKDNPADMASRGASAAEMTQSSCWFLGPSFLWRNNLPSPNVSDIADILDDPEVRQSKCFLSKTEDTSLLNRFEYFSSWSRLVRAVSVCLRFKQ